MTADQRLTVEQIARRTGVSPRMLHYAEKVRRYGIPELLSALSGGSISAARAANVAALPPDQQRAVLPAALRRQWPPKKPTKAARLANELEQWQICAGRLAREVSRLTGVDAASVLVDAFERSS